MQRVLLAGILALTFNAALASNASALQESGEEYVDAVYSAQSIEEVRPIVLGFSRQHGGWAMPQNHTGLMSSYLVGFARSTMCGGRQPCYDYPAKGVASPISYLGGDVGQIEWRQVEGGSRMAILTFSRDGSLVDAEMRRRYFCQDGKTESNSILRSFCIDIKNQRYLVLSEDKSIHPAMADKFRLTIKPLTIKLEGDFGG